MKSFINNNKKLRKLVLQFAEIGKYMWKKGWAESGAGNISANLDVINLKKIYKIKIFEYVELQEAYPALAGKYFMVSGTGKRMRDLAKHPFKNMVIIRLDNKGKSYGLINFNNGDKIKPTSELSTHLGLHQLIAERGGNEKVIIHAHATELIALTHMVTIKSNSQINNILWGMHPETMFFIPKGIGFVPYKMQGSPEIALSTIKEFKNHDIVLWEMHGVFAIGKDILNTFDQIDIACKSAKIWFMCKSAGFEPEMLSVTQLEMLREHAAKIKT
jgi:rhamnulose-1-phosphate aldolase